MSDRATIIARLRKLAAMTIAAGCSEAEAAFASERLAALMREHNIGETELSIKDDASRCGVDEFMVFGQGGEWLGLTAAIARAFSARAWQAKRNEDVLGLGYHSEVTYMRFFGFEADVAASATLMSICYNAVMQEQNVERSTLKRQSFIAGMIARLTQRVSELKVRPASGTTGTALISLKDQLVEDAWTKYAKENLNLRRDRSRSKQYDPSAYSRGSAAGQRVDINGGAKLYGARQIGVSR